MSNEKKFVLLVDDDVDIQDIIRAALELEGYNVLVAENGAKGLELLKTKKSEDIGCIILDLMMPVMDGTKMLEILRSTPEWSKIPVVISTAKGTVSKEDVDRADAVVKKPMKVETLYDVIGRYTKPTH